MSQGLEIAVRDGLFDPNGETRTPEWRTSEGKPPLYKVHIFLEGTGLLHVRRATYFLDETFDPPIREVPRTVSNPNCRLTIWTWGIFDVRVVVEDKGGRRYEFIHPLTYGEEISRTPQSQFRKVS